MALQQVLAIREPGQEIPPEFRKVASEKFTTAIGFVAPLEAGNDAQQIGGGDYDLVEAIKTLETNYGKNRIFYYFVEADAENISPESIQPFHLITEGEGEQETALISVLLAGEFPAYDDQNEEGETHTPEYHCAMFLKSLADEMWDLCGKEVSLFMGMLGKKPYKEKIEAVLGPRATILFIPCRGPAKSFSNVKPENALSLDGKFYATDNLGLKVDGSVKEEKKTAALPGKLSLKKPPAVEGGSAITPEEQYKKLLGREDKQFVIVGGKLWCKPPVGADWKRARSWWNDHYDGQRPKDATEVYKGFSADKLKDDSPLKQVILTMNQTDKPKPKEADTVQSPAEPKPDAKKETETTLFIPKDQKERYLALKNAGKLNTTDIASLLASLKKYPLASVALGENASEMLMLSNEALERIVTGAGHKVVLGMLQQFRCLALDLSVDDEAPPEKKPVEQPAETTKPKLSLKRA